MENDLYSLVKSSFPEILGFQLSEITWALLPQVDIVAYYNGVHPSFGSPLPFGSLIMWDSAVSLDGKLWQSCIISRHLVSHSNCGGVSDGTTTAVFALHRSLCHSFNLPAVLDFRYPATELTSILNPKQFRFRAPSSVTFACPAIDPSS